MLYPASFPTMLPGYPGGQPPHPHKPHRRRPPLGRWRSCPSAPRNGYSPCRLLPPYPLYPVPYHHPSFHSLPLPWGYEGFAIFRSLPMPHDGVFDSQHSGDPGLKHGSSPSRWHLLPGAPRSWRHRSPARAGSHRCAGRSACTSSSPRPGNQIA